MLEALFRLQRYKIKCIYARVEAKKMYFYFNFCLNSVEDISKYGAPVNTCKSLPCGSVYALWLCRG